MAKSNWKKSLKKFVNAHKGKLAFFIGLFIGIGIAALLWAPFIAVPSMLTMVVLTAVIPPATAFVAWGISKIIDCARGKSHAQGDQNEEYEGALRDQVDETSPLVDSEALQRGQTEVSVQTAQQHKHQNKGRKKPVQRAKSLDSFPTRAEDDSTTFGFGQQNRLM